MRRRLISALLLVTVILSVLPLSSCHGDRDPMPVFDVPSDFDTDKEYSITFWAKHESNLQQREVYANAVSDFHKLYPNITVTVKEYTNYNDIYNDVITNISTDTTPNVCITYPDHIATYITGENVVVPLDELMKDRKYGLGGSEVRFDSPELSEIVPEFLEECIVSGLYYAMPYMRSTEALYINKTYVEKLGYTVPDVVTWDFVFEVSAAAMKKNPDGTYKVNGQKIMKPFIYKSTDNMMIQMLRQLGADYSTEAGDILIFNDDTKDILNTVAENVKKGAFTTFSISSYPGNFLNKGQCIFGVDSTAGATWMGPDAPNIDINVNDLVDFEMVVRPVPQFDIDNPQMISQGPSVCVFNKEDPGEVLASWLFVQYLLSNKVQIAYAQTEGYVPVTTKAQSDPEYLDYLSRAGERDENGDPVELYYNIKLDASRLLIDNVGSSFVTPVFNGSVSLRNAAGQMIERVAEDVSRKAKINDAYFENLFDSIESLYRLDQIGTGDQYKKRIDALPTGAVALISGVVAVNLLLLALIVFEKLKKAKK
ncbi:MAG: extracellular solute-binding protein [Clostridia bacterium]|nr:extracellular solute-binding protein [Clostridia bacterium]